MYCISGLTKKDFLKIFKANNRYEFDATCINDSCRLNKNDGINLIWFEKPSNFCSPNCIVLRKQNITDFLAWCWSYCRDFCPLSSITRIMTFEEFYNVSIYSNYQKDNDFYSLAFALTVSEVTLLAFYRNINITHFKAIAYISTFSYAAAQHILSKGTISIKELFGRWSLVRNITNQREIKGDLSSLVEIWEAVFDYYKKISSKPKSSDLLSNILNKYGISIIKLKKLTNYDQEENSLFSTNKSPEDKVSEIELFSKQMLHENNMYFNKSIIFSYLVNNIDCGSFNHFKYLLSKHEDFPDAAFWYALFAFGSIPNSLKGLPQREYIQFVNRLSSREKLSNYPECDFNFYELTKIMSKSKIEFSGYLFSSEYQNIEISPNVNVIFKSTYQKDDSKNDQKINYNEYRKLFIDTKKKLTIARNALDTLSSKVL